MRSLIEIKTDINLKKLAKQILKNEPKIIKKYPAKTINLKEDFDGATGLGFNSLTSRSCHFNILDWWGTGSLRRWMRDGYEKYHNIQDTPLYVQCWANVMRKGDQIKSHKHESRDGVSPIKHLCGHLSVQVDGSTSTYYDGSPILNKNGQMTFFPAHTFQWTDRYENNSDRITVAFDILSGEFYNEDIFDQYKKHWVKI